MGPVSRYLGPEVPQEQLLWQDPLPPKPAQILSTAEISALKDKILSSGLTVAELVQTAWASASTFRGGDKRGGANGARIALEPQVNWTVNNPPQLERVLGVLAEIKGWFDSSGATVSLADLIVLGGVAAVEKAAKDGGHEIEVPFTPGRVDATQEQTDVESVSYLEPRADGFRNYIADGASLPGEYLLVDKANLLTLSAPQMTALIGGLRVLGNNWDGSATGVLTDRPGVLTNDFFVNLLDNDTTWTRIDEKSTTFSGSGSNGASWTASRADLVFGANAELRAIAEVYASAGGAEKLVHDFVAAFDKVMNLDRYDVTA